MTIPAVWLGMIQNLQRARQETGRECRILMDIPGPKLRTGPIEPGPAVVKCRPKRDDYGRVVAPARIWLTSNENTELAPAVRCCTLRCPLPFSKNFARAIRFAFATRARRNAPCASLMWILAAPGPKLAKPFTSFPAWRSSKRSARARARTFAAFSPRPVSASFPTPSSAAAQAGRHARAHSRKHTGQARALWQIR